MQKLMAALAVSCFLFSSVLNAQSVKFDTSTLEAVNVFMTVEKLNGNKAIKVRKNPAVIKVDEPTFVRIKGIDFRDGTIEVKVLSRLTKNAPDYARGFIGVAFRINDSNSRYESVYQTRTIKVSDTILLQVKKFIQHTYYYIVLVRLDRDV